MQDGLLGEELQDLSSATSTVIRVGYSALTERQEAEMEVAELKMSPISLGVTRMGNVRNEYIRWTLQLTRLERKQEKHGYIGRWILRM